MSMEARLAAAIPVVAAAAALGARLAHASWGWSAFVGALVAASALLVGMRSLPRTGIDPRRVQRLHVATTRRLVIFWWAWVAVTLCYRVVRVAQTDSSIGSVLDLRLLLALTSALVCSAWVLARERGRLP